MSWRELFGVVEGASPSYAQNPQYPQNHHGNEGSEDCEDIERRDEELLGALAEISGGLPITALEVRDALAPEDIEDWRNGDFGRSALRAFAKSLVQRREMKKGQVPAHYTEQATCEQCGHVYLWTHGHFNGCPWCWNREAGLPIPRPTSVQCGGCVHFERLNHPNLGRCMAGEKGPPAGFWAMDRKVCRAS